MRVNPVLHRGNTQMMRRVVACDRTLARIGDVLPVTPAESSTEAGSNSASPVPTNSHMIDGIGRMIDVIA